MKRETHLLLAVILCNFVCLATVASGKEISFTDLQIIAVEPAQPGWPVILAVIYSDPNSDGSDMIYVWSFPQQQDQSCTVRGRIYVHPCIGKVVEHTWGTTGQFEVTLNAYSGGGGKATISRLVVIENYSGPTVARQEIRTLGADKWLTIRNTLVTMKQTGIYDHFVYIHQLSSAFGMRQGSFRNQAHRGPAFGPWHRALIRIFERTLQVMSGDPTIGLPYWDWTIEAAMENPKTSFLWNDTYFGPNGDPTNHWAVPSGCFCSVQTYSCTGQWPVRTDLAGPILTREMGVSYNRLPTAKEISEILAKNSAYDVAPYDDSVAEALSFRNCLEGWPHNSQDKRKYGRAHNAVHDWVGGSMIPYTSANDPIFWFHHSQVDRLFYTWQVRTNCYAGCYHPIDHDPTITKHTPAAMWQYGEWRLPGHHWSDWMYPWWVRPRDVFDSYNSLVGYNYV